MNALLVSHPQPGSGAVAAGEDGQESVNGTAGPESPATHVVARGESLWLVATRYRVALEKLRRWNALNRKSLLYPGQVLRLTAP